MSWNFRLVRHKDPRTSAVWYGIHEVFYNEAGRPFTMTEDPVDIAGRSPREVRGYLKMIQRDIERLPILDAHRTRWVKPPWDSGRRARTPLERAVDRELISKGKDALKDFDESQVLHVPARKGKKRRRERF